MMGLQLHPVAIAVAIAVAILAATPVAAQDNIVAPPVTVPSQASDGRLQFPASYFAEYAPTTALDMVRRLPGFAIIDVDPSVRGFGQTAGNVVINGQRPSSKTDPIETILSRIPASRVLRIEIGSGDVFGAEFSGKPQVANLVLAAGGGLAGNIDATLSRLYTGRIFPAGSLSALLHRGPSTFTASADFTNQVQTETGPDTLFRPGDGHIVEARFKRNDSQDRGQAFAASWALDEGTNRTAHLNGRFLAFGFDLDQRNRVSSDSGVRRDDRLSQLVRGHEYEIGGDITRPFGGGGIKLTALATRSHRRAGDESLNIIDPQIVGGFAQSALADRQESVARLVWSRPSTRGWGIELGGEGALNQLDSQVDLFGNANGGARSRIDLPVDNVRVREYRGEAFVNVGRALTSRLRGDFSLTYELSRLTVTGDAQSARTLRYLKPKAAFDWRLGGDWHAQLSIERTVAQLDFDDFVSAAELTSERINGGNAELLPQRTWALTTTIDHPFLGNGTVRVELLAQRISQVQDRVPTPEGFDAPGNLGSGELYQVKLTIDTPLDRLGIRGGRVNFTGRLQDSSVIDPYTKMSRNFSDHIHGWDFDTTFRQDLGRFAWGLAWYGQPPRDDFRRDEVDRRYGPAAYLEAFAEYRPSPRTTVRFGLNNLADQAFRRRRTFYAPDRTSAVPLLIEERARTTHLTAFINFKRSLGS